MEDLGCVDFEEEIKKRTKMIYVPNWFTVDLKTGVGIQRHSGCVGEQRLARPVGFQKCLYKHHFRQQWIVFIYLLVHIPVNMMLHLKVHNLH